MILLLYLLKIIGNVVSTDRRETACFFPPSPQKNNSSGHRECFWRALNFLYPWSVLNCKRLIFKSSMYSRPSYNTIILWLLSSIRHWERWIYWSITRKCKRGQLLHCAAHKLTPRVLPALARLSVGQVRGWLFFFQKRSISVSREIQASVKFPSQVTLLLSEFTILRKYST